MQYVPEMVKWAQKNIDIVQVMVFILYRAVNNSQVDFYLGPKKIDMDDLVYNEEVTERTDIQADEIVELIRTEYPDFDPCSYLNGSEKPDSKYMAIWEEKELKLFKPSIICFMTGI